MINISKFTVMSLVDVQLTSPVLICQTAYDSCTSSPSIANLLPLFAIALSTHLLTGKSKFNLRKSIVNLGEFLGKSLGSTMHTVFEFENPSSSDPTGVSLWRFRSGPFWPVSVALVARALGAAQTPFKGFRTASAGQTEYSRIYRRCRCFRSICSR